MKNIHKHIESKKSAYVKLPRLVRGLIVVAAFVIGGMGAILSLTPPPLFDIGIILLLLSLSILSFQFKWAHSALVYVTDRLADKSFRKKFLLGIVIVFAIGISGALLYWFN